MLKRHDLIKAIISRLLLSLTHIFTAILSIMGATQSKIPEDVVSQWVSLTFLNRNTILQ